MKSIILFVLIVLILVLPRNSVKVDVKIDLKKANTEGGTKIKKDSLARLKNHKPAE